MAEAGFDVKADFREVERYLSSAQQRLVPRAGARALNKTGAKVRTEAGRTLRARHRNLKARVVRDQLRLDKASRRQLVATVTASGKPIALKHYKPKRRQIRGKKGIGRFGQRLHEVSVEVIPGQRTVFHGAFFGPNGHIFVRSGKSRLPIEKQFGPSLGSAFVKAKVRTAMASVANDAWRRNFNHELRRELDKLANKAKR